MKTKFSKIVIGFLILLVVLFFAVRYTYGEGKEKRSDNSTLAQIENHLEKIANQLEKINYTSSLTLPQIENHLEKIKYKLEDIEEALQKKR